MASEAENSELSALFDRLFTRQRDLSLFFPFILGFGNNEPSQDSSNENRGERIILINSFTQGMVVIEGGAASTLESIIRELVNSKSGPPPASKSSIEAMPSVVAGESDGECVICLEEWEAGEGLKEMPCKHMFHGKCIEKWLRIHGSCPVCRYKMPAEDDETGKKRDDEDGSERRRLGREIWVSFSLNDGNRERENENSSQRPEDHEMEN